MVENEINAIVNCRVYEDLRDTHFRKACTMYVHLALIQCPMKRNL